MAHPVREAREGPAQVPYDASLATVPSGIGNALGCLKKYNFFHQFFFMETPFPEEYILEACRRSEKFNRTSIRDQGAYFMCLVAGRRNISDAMKLVGCGMNDTVAFIAFESGHENELKNCGVITETYLFPKDSREIYGQMTMTEMELIN